jgi:hypothetical protein
VTIWRAARYRRDFAEIEIELPDTKLMLFDRGDVQNWKGATAEQIAGILQRHVPASRLGDFSLAGRPISVAEADARFARERQRLESAQKPFQHMTWWFWLVKIATFVFIGAGFGVMIALYALMFYGMAWFIRREARQTQARYEQERAELLDANRDDHDDQSLTGDELEAGIEVGT